MDGKQNYKAPFVPPNLFEAKRRGRSEVKVLQFEDIPEEMKKIGYGKRYLIRTYGCHRENNALYAKRVINKAFRVSFVEFKLFLIFFRKI